MIRRHIRAWTIPVASSSVLHLGIAWMALWLAFAWTPPRAAVLPTELVAPEPPPLPRESPPPAVPPPKLVSAVKPVPPPPVPVVRELPRPEPPPEVARPAPVPEEPSRPPEVAKVPEPSAPRTEAPAPLARSTPAEIRPAEIRKEQTPATSGSQSRVAPDPAPTTAIDLPAQTRAPARESSVGVAAAPSPAPVVVARPGEVTRTARPSGGYQVIPPYPVTARQQRVEGTTLLRVLVLDDGRVGDVAVQKSAGHPDLDQAATDAVRQWRFDPARKGAEAVAMWVLLPVQFHLTQN